MIFFIQAMLVVRANDSIWHKSTPRLTRMYPEAPHPVPQELRTTLFKNEFLKTFLSTG